MEESRDYISFEMETILVGGKQDLIQTGSGVVSVIVYGDQAKPALIIYPDLALNHVSCFQGLFFCPEAASLLLHHFCIYHISTPVHELGSAPIRLHQSAPCVEGLADQILQVLNHFGLGSVMCMGVTAGAYILTLFALKYHRRVLGLIVISPFCKSAPWKEWICNKLLSNLLYFYGMSNYVKENLIRRYFGKEFTRGGNSDADVHESDIVRACRKLLDERQSTNVLRFLQAMNDRPDISGKLEKLNCRTLIFVGELSPFRSEALHMSSKLCGKKYNNGFVEVRACGSMVTEEEPHAMLVPMELFLMGYGLFRPKMVSRSPMGPLNPPCISPQELSPESLGLNLKPIRTRVVKSHQ